MSNEEISFRISILRSSQNGSSVYSEEHTVTTNTNGLATMIIGKGLSADEMESIDWSDGPYYLKVEVDPEGGFNYIAEDTTQLLSVPYALYSNSSGSALTITGQDYLTISNNEITVNKVDLTDDVVSNAFAKFKVLADKKKHVYDEDIIALIDDSLIIDNKVNAINLKSLKVFAGTGEPQKAEMTLDVFGDVKKTSETGDGPVDAIFKCIKKLYPHDVKLSLYQVHAVTEGTDAQATVSVKIEENDRTTVGQSADTDTLVASANAYLNALNKMLIKREKKSLYKNIEPKKLKESI